MADTKQAETLDDRLLHRLLFFSDAVFAIVLTLLVLELRPPEVHEESGLIAAVLAMSPHLVAFVTTFVLISVFWAVHMSMTRNLIRFDWLVAWLNLAVLFVIALMPFASAMLGEYGVFGEAWQIYCAVLVLASLTQSGLLLAVFRDSGRLVSGYDARDGRLRLLRALSPGIAFAGGLAASLAGFTHIAAFCGLLIVPIMLAARFIFRAPKAASRATKPARKPPTRPAAKARRR